MIIPSTPATALMKRAIKILRQTVESLALSKGPAQPLAYVGGWLSHGNLGDEILLSAANRLFPNHRVWHFDGNRFQSQWTRLMPGIQTGVLAGGTLINRAPSYRRTAEAFLGSGRSRLAVLGTGVADTEFWHQKGGYQDNMNCWV